MARPSLRRALLGGRIIFNNKSSVFDCVIREISDRGAVLQVGSTFALPTVFTLETKPWGHRYACRAERFTQMTVEVAFLPQPH